MLLSLLVQFSIVIQKPISLENEHFNLKLYISTNTYGLFQSHFSKLFTGVFCYLLKLTQVKKKNSIELFSDIAAERNKI